jgi:hypothetical protein
MKDIAWHPGRGFAGCRGHECLPDPTSRTGKARSWPRPRPRRGPRARALKWSRAAGMSALFRAHDRQRHGRCAMQGPRKAACRGAAQGGVPRGRGAAARTPWPPAKPRWGCIRTGTRLAGGTMRHRARAPESGDSPARASRQRACAAVAAAHAKAEPPRQRPPSRARAARGGPRPSHAHRGGLAPDPPGDRAFARLGRLPALPPGGVARPRPRAPGPAPRTAGVEADRLAAAGGSRTRAPSSTARGACLRACAVGAGGLRAAGTSPARVGGREPVRRRAPSGALRAHAGQPNRRRRARLRRGAVPALVRRPAASRRGSKGRTPVQPTPPRGRRARCRAAGAAPVRAGGRRAYAQGRHGHRSCLAWTARCWAAAPAWPELRVARACAAGGPAQGAVLPATMAVPRPLPRRRRGGHGCACCLVVAAGRCGGRNPNRLGTVLVGWATLAIVLAGWAAPGHWAGPLSCLGCSAICLAGPNLLFLFYFLYIYSTRLCDCL